ncbi:MAG TPA: hypothetical protein VNL71_02915 [Chloroflexota bacterium]|nr:hypothetical protein [Chloroflexota bacterium]
MARINSFKANPTPCPKTERRAFVLYTGVNAVGLALGTYVILRAWPRGQRLLVPLVLTLAPPVFWSS